VSTGYLTKVLQIIAVGKTLETYGGGGARVMVSSTWRPSATRGRS
jgi:hypothetical protein